VLYPLINHKSSLYVRFKLLLYKIYARPTLLFVALIWAAAARSHLDRLQRFKNKFLRIILNAPYDTRTEDLHKEAELESIDKFDSNAHKRL